MTIGIIGFGRFGALAASVLKGFAEVKVFKHRNGEEERRKAALAGVPLVELEEAAGCDIVVLATPISQTEKTLVKIAPMVKEGALILDTCSVKVYPCLWLKKHMPAGVEIMGTHPMFGPVTSQFDLAAQKWSLSGLQIVLCPVRIGKARLRAVKGFLARLGLDVIVTTPADHDSQNATTLGLVHFVGRALRKTGARQQRIFTPGYSDLLKILPHTTGDNWQLFFDMHNFNPYARAVRKRFTEACEDMEDKIARSRAGDTLDSLRGEIEQIDREVMRLLERRFECTGKIGRLKKRRGWSLVDSRREKELVERMHGQSRMDREFIERFYGLLFSQSYKTQQ